MLWHQTITWTNAYFYESGLVWQTLEKLEWEKMRFFVPQNTFEGVVCKMSEISSRHQCFLHVALRAIADWKSCCCQVNFVAEYDVVWQFFWQLSGLHGLGSGTACNINLEQCPITTVMGYCLELTSSFVRNVIDADSVMWPIKWVHGLMFVPHTFNICFQSGRNGELRDYNSVVWIINFIFSSHL